MKHKHRIIPGHKGGTYSSENVVLVSPTCHAMWHFCEWQREGNKKDYIAWKGLSKGGGCPPTTAVVYKGINYKSLTEAAKINDVTISNVSKWCERRRQGVGIGKGNTINPKGKGQKSCVVKGLKFNSQKEASDYFNVSPVTIGRWITNSKHHAQRLK